MTTRFPTLFLGAALLSAGCSARVTSPSTPAPVRVTAQATPTFVGGSDTATFTVRVDNISQVVGDLTQAIVLPAGDYAIYGRLEDSTHRVQSDQVAFSVR